jgi:hypothetical protein
MQKSGKWKPDNILKAKDLQKKCPAGTYVRRAKNELLLGQ